MKTLKTIQTISKIGKIISKIVNICCIVGFCGCIIGIISLAAGGGVLKLGGFSLHGIIENEADISEGALYIAMSTGAVFCAGEAVLSGFAAHYFDRELKDGTPFTFNGAKEMLRLGILAVCIPLASQTVAAIIEKILTTAFAENSPSDFGFSSISIGIMFIVTSLICRYGAELTSGNPAGSQTGGSV